MFALSLRNLVRAILFIYGLISDDINSPILHIVQLYV
jgi:hypothetical protein